MAEKLYTHNNKISSVFSPFSLRLHDLSSILLIDGLDEGHIVHITTIGVLKLLTISYSEERGGNVILYSDLLNT